MHSRQGAAASTPSQNNPDVSKHSPSCKANFRRRDWTCPLCVQLMLRAAPSNGWQHAYFARNSTFSSTEMVLLHRYADRKRIHADTAWRDQVKYALICFCLLLFFGFIAL